MNSESVAYFALNMEEYVEYLGAVVRGEETKAAELAERAGMSKSEFAFVMKRQSENGVEAARNFIRAGASW